MKRSVAYVTPEPATARVIAPPHLMRTGLRFGPFEVVERCKKLEIHGAHRYEQLGDARQFRCPGKHGSDPL